MKKMMVLGALVALTGLGFTADLPASQAVDHKELQKFLPVADVPGFVRGKPEGQTSTVMNITTSEASVQHKKEGDQYQVIVIKIEDVTGLPVAAAGAIMMAAAQFDTQTENGYEKSIKLKDFPGTEKLEKGDFPWAEIMVIVAKRFIITGSLQGGDDVDILRKLIEGMDLQGLAALAK